MEIIAKYRTAIQSLLAEVEKGSYVIPEIKSILLKDKDHYLIIRMGWSNDQNLYSIIAHIAIFDEKIWIYRNNTEYDFEEELTQQGVSKEDIVFGEISPSQRQELGYSVS
jgi:mRNA-degrading endonuclease HigB of HigAB toxin-antitoxin module